MKKSNTHEYARIARVALGIFRARGLPYQTSSAHLTSGGAVASAVGSRSVIGRVSNSKILDFQISGPHDSRVFGVS